MRFLLLCSIAPKRNLLIVLKISFSLHASDQHGQRGSTLLRHLIWFRKEWHFISSHHYSQAFQNMELSNFIFFLLKTIKILIYEEFLTKE